jgi:uncharacterized protein (TIGR02453 family)
MCRAAMAASKKNPAKEKAQRVVPASGATATSPEFGGFSDDCIAFLAELRLNNDRDWFKANQARYERSVRDPALAFIRAMAPHLAEISRQFVASDKKVGGSLMRLQRDTRFGANKEPYKINVGIQFRHVVGKDVHAPGFYFHIDPDRVFVGVGLWRPEADALRAVRQRIVAKPKEYQAATSAVPFLAKFEMGGASLVRPPQGFDPEHPLLEALKRKDHIAGADLPHRSIRSATLISEVTGLYRLGSPLLKFLCRALGLAY